jgi:hypothetical protein
VDKTINVEVRKISTRPSHIAIYMSSIAMSVLSKLKALIARSRSRRRRL